MGLAGIVVVMQMIGTYAVSQSYLENVNRIMRTGKVSTEQFIVDSGTISVFHVATSNWLIGSLEAAEVILVLYIFGI